MDMDIDTNIDTDIDKDIDMDIGTGMDITRMSDISHNFNPSSKRFPHFKEVPPPPSNGQLAYRNTKSSTTRTKETFSYTSLILLSYRQKSRLSGMIARRLTPSGKKTHKNKQQKHTKITQQQTNKQIHKQPTKQPKTTTTIKTKTS